MPGLMKVIEDERQKTGGKPKPKFPIDPKTGGPSHPKPGETPPIFNPAVPRKGRGRTKMKKKMGY